MCGIAGAIALRAAPCGISDPLDRIVERMAKRLMHRGPDGAGLWKAPSGRIALSHRRLAIIDLTDTGRQPMEYAGRFWMTFNGEIYNFKELRPQLLALGHSFHGESDTEVLLAAIAQWGMEDALSRCVGMFAFAVWDARIASCTSLAIAWARSPSIWVRSAAICSLPRSFAPLGRYEALTRK